MLTFNHLLTLHGLAANAGVHQESASFPKLCRNAVLVRPHRLGAAVHEHRRLVLLLIRLMFLMASSASRRRKVSWRAVKKAEWRGEMGNWSKEDT